LTDPRPGGPLLPPADPARDAAYENAELRIINEELQTANEELRASRDELRMLNAELQAINAELADRLATLTGHTEDAARLLAATRIAVLLLDRGGRVRAFTPRAAEMFALAQADIARPVASLGMRVPYGELEQDWAEARDAGRGVFERRILLASGRVCLVRVLPHTGADGIATGTVFTFLELP
jgi:two-component system, chemotaxis family, CheB/CheR fusion protein